MTNDSPTGKICSYTWNEYNNYGGELTVIRRYDNEDVSDCLTMASILHKLHLKHHTRDDVPEEWKKTQHADYVVLSIMEINQ